MQSVPFVDLGRQYESIRPDVETALSRVLSACDFILGRDVEEFEAAFARYVGTAHAVGVSSGLDALRLGLEAVGVRPGDEVILPAFTFVATALAVSAVGARPVLVDCDPATYNLSAEKVEAAITQRTRALIPVHLTGQAADMDPLLEIGERRGIAIVEDAAQAHGARHRDRACGSMGAVGCFSFYPGKNLGAYGDAGLVTTNDARIAERLRRLRNYGQSAKYQHVEKGWNARIDTIQAAVLRVKLPHLDDWNRARARHAESYRRLLARNPGLRLQGRSPESTHVYHLFVVETERRDELVKHLTNEGIGVGIHYPKPVHLLPAYVDLGCPIGSFPEAERLSKRVLSLPMFAELTEGEIEQVSQAISSFFQSLDTRAELPSRASLGEGSF